MQGCEVVWEHIRYILELLDSLAEEAFSCDEFSICLERLGDRRLLQSLHGLQAKSRNGVAPWLLALMLEEFQGKLIVKREARPFAVFRWIALHGGEALADVVQQ